MLMSMISVPLATKSPWRQSASMPYGFSPTSVGGGGGGGAGGLASDGAGLTSIAAPGAVSALGACAIASLELTIAAPIETAASATANRLRTSNGLRFIFPDPENNDLKFTKNPSTCRERASLELPDVLDASPRPFGLPVDRGRSESAQAQPRPCALVEAPEAGGPVAFPLHPLALRLDPQPPP